MKMFEQTGEFQPDSLIVSCDFPILTGGIGLKAGYGLLKRGSLIVKGADKAGYIAGAQAEETAQNVFGILTDDVDTRESESDSNIPATVYQTGVFNRAAVIVSGEDTALETYEDAMRDAGMFLRSVQDAE